ncbi:Zinc finger protein [Actinidia chinensis var. chinensis]|uniref:Zinc finger protein n=1 Tax=Actinidia chinensis var. chinensis TaxID=1590841 RepID=A0A2R6RRC6_ACTCC|nr:Zinc finger protein [Actinidia chinensis var. chinensis]
MADTVDGRGLLMNKENFNNWVPNFAFPAEFPYDFEPCDSSSENSPVDSVVSSTETERDSLSELTRKLACSSLQEKTQNINFAPLNLKVASPPATVLGGKIESRNVVYAAAEQAVRWKMNGGGPPKGIGLLGPHRNLSPVHDPPPPVKNTMIGFYANEGLSNYFSQSNHFEHARGDQLLKQQRSSILGRPNREDLFSQQNQFRKNLMSQNRGERVFFGSGFESNARYVPPLQILHHNQRPLHGGSAVGAAVVHDRSRVKRECVGTGVFLPRRYAKTSESRKKPGGCSAAPPPARVVHALNKNSNNISAQAQTCFTGSLVPNYDALMASRKAILTQQKQSLRPERVTSHELSLPQEWTY